MGNNLSVNRSANDDSGLKVVIDERDSEKIMPTSTAMKQQKHGKTAVAEKALPEQAPTDGGVNAETMSNSNSKPSPFQTKLIPPWEKGK
jgi:hypothetical protein